MQREIEDRTTPQSARRRRFRRAAIAILVLSVLPMIPVIFAASVAHFAGCRLDESGAHPCLIGGFDAGPVLYTVGMGFFFIALLAMIAGAGAAAIWIAAVVIYVLRGMFAGR
jgi:hypothetical protein